MEVRTANTYFYFPCKYIEATCRYLVVKKCKGRVNDDVFILQHETKPAPGDHVHKDEIYTSRNDLRGVKG
jgi:hypothetical protein